MQKQLAKVRDKCGTHNQGNPNPLALALRSGPDCESKFRDCRRGVEPSVSNSKLVSQKSQKLKWRFGPASNENCRMQKQIAKGSN